MNIFRCNGEMGIIRMRIRVRISVSVFDISTALGMYGRYHIHKIRSIYIYEKQQTKIFPPALDPKDSEK